MCSLLAYKGFTLDCWGAGASKNGGEAANFCESDEDFQKDSESGLKSKNTKESFI